MTCHLRYTLDVWHYVLRYFFNMKFIHPTKYACLVSFNRIILCIIVLVFIHFICGILIQVFFFAIRYDAAINLVWVQLYSVSKIFAKLIWKVNLGILPVLGKQRLFFFFLNHDNICNSFLVSISLYSTYSIWSLCFSARKLIYELLLTWFC